MRLFLILIMVIGVVFAQGAHAQNQSQKRIIVGYIENIGVPKIGLTEKAKLDTGAATSSMHASVIELNEGDDEEDGYVIFTMDDGEGESNHMKKQVVRMVNIKTKKGGSQRRPVVMMTFCIAGVLVEGEVNLSDRKHFNYSVLVGRNMLEKGQLIVDASKTFTARPNCPEPQKKSEESE